MASDISFSVQWNTWTSDITFNRILFSSSPLLSSSSFRHYHYYYCYFHCHCHIHCHCYCYHYYHYYHQCLNSCEWQSYQLNAELRLLFRWSEEGHVSSRHGSQGDTQWGYFMASSGMTDHIKGVHTTVPTVVQWSYDVSKGRYLHFVI